MLQNRYYEYSPMSCAPHALVSTYVCGPPKAIPGQQWQEIKTQTICRYVSAQERLQIAIRDQDGKLESNTRIPSTLQNIDKFFENIPKTGLYGNFLQFGFF